MGLWSRFWSVVPKAIVKAGRDAVSDVDAPADPRPNAAAPVDLERSDSPPSVSPSETPPSEASASAAEPDDAPPESRKRTL